MPFSVFQDRGRSDSLWFSTQQSDREDDFAGCRLAVCICYGKSTNITQTPDIYEKQLKDLFLI